MHATAGPCSRIRLRSLWVLALSLLFLIFNFIMVALPWHWVRAKADLRPLLLGDSVRITGWPPVENVFVVIGPDSPRLVRVDSGSFEDWELPLASRLHTILDVRVTGMPRADGLWSPLWVTHRRALSIVNISTGQPADEAERALALGVYGNDLMSRGVKAPLVDALLEHGEVRAVRPAWGGIANEALVLLAFAAFLASMGSVADLLAARRRRLLEAGICPDCRYHAGRLDRCPECGGWLRYGEG